MPRRTRKYTAAERTARSLGLQVDPTEDDAAELYRQLEDQNYRWNSKTGSWEDWGSMPADEPSPLIRIRCWAPAEAVEMIADGVVESMLAAGLRLLDRSKAYPCRPPQQLESRIYLIFEPLSLAH